MPWEHATLYAMGACDALCHGSKGRYMPWEHAMLYAMGACDAICHGSMRCSMPWEQATLYAMGACKQRAAFALTTPHTHTHIHVHIDLPHRQPARDPVRLAPLLQHAPCTSTQHSASPPLPLTPQLRRFCDRFHGLVAEAECVPGGSITYIQTSHTHIHTRMHTHACTHVCTRKHTHTLTHTRAPSAGSTAPDAPPPARPRPCG